MELNKVKNCAAKYQNQVSKFIRFSFLLSIIQTKHLKIYNTFSNLMIKKLSQAKIGTFQN